MMKVMRRRVKISPISRQRGRLAHLLQLVEPGLLLAAEEQMTQASK
jgi:hypothetical protein